MMRKNSKRIRRHGYTTVLDVGTTKTCCWIARKDEQNQFYLIGTGYQASQGISGGQVTDMNALEVVISQAIHDAEKESGEVIRDIWLNVGGKHIDSTLVQEQIDIKGQTVTEEDISLLLAQAKNQKDAESAAVIHALPLQYTLDGQQGIQDPVGMVGKNLDANIHLVSGLHSSLQNLSICIERCHLNICGVVASGYASGLACLSDDEQTLGATLIDIGSGMTSIAGFLDGHLIYTSYIPLGGRHITNDIARGLGTTISHAERLKVLYGAGTLTESDYHEIIPVHVSGDAQQEICLQLPRSRLVEIIQPRTEEILQHVKQNIKMSGMEPVLGQRVVLTGGCSQLPGIRELAALVLKKNVRLGESTLQFSPKDWSKPSFSTIAGLLKYSRMDGFYRASQIKGRSEGRLLGPWNKITSWLRENL